MTVRVTRAQAARLQGECIAVTVRRWACPWCGRTRARRRDAANHAETCARNPANRACSTCRHFERTPCCAYNNADCGCKGLNMCAVEAFETWRYNDHDTRAPVEKGWWTHTVDWRRDCDQWETA